MRRELYFRLVSVAALGLLALACVPSVRTSSPQSVPSVAPSVVPFGQIEIDSVQEVESINFHGFTPYVRPSETTPAQIISPSSI
jgi:hypothetical protein